MILVIGGFAAGKCDWVRAHLGYAGAAFSREIADDCPVLFDLQDCIAPDETLLARKSVIVCNEIGCGLVPIDPAQRERREAVGRLCITLAAKAQCVVRVVCGVGVVIRGEPTWT